MPNSLKIKLYLILLVSHDREFNLKSLNKMLQVAIQTLLDFWEIFSAPASISMGNLQLKWVFRIDKENFSLKDVVSHNPNFIICVQNDGLKLGVTCKKRSCSCSAELIA